MRALTPERVVGALGATFRDIAEDWYAHGKATRGWKPSTQRDYRSALDAHLLPAFNDKPLREITTATIEAWRNKRIADPEKPLPIRTAVKLSAILHGILARACKTRVAPPRPGPASGRATGGEGVGREGALRT